MRRLNGIDAYFLYSETPTAPNHTLKVGVYEPYPNGTDTGRHKVTGNEAEKYFFKVPSLLNVEKTAPYNHDGGVKSLEEAVKQMAKIQLQKNLKDDEIASIVAFGVDADSPSCPSSPAALV